MHKGRYPSGRGCPVLNGHGQNHGAAELQGTRYCKSVEMLCQQFGIALPDNSVNIPEYEQLTLTDVTVKN